jgi:hypothetical protein
LHFILAELESYTIDGKEPKHTKMKPFIILFYLDVVVTISTTLASFAWDLDISNQKGQK